MDKLKAIVVDDSVLYRKVLSDSLSSFPDVEVIGTVANGKLALDKIETLKPDFITLDFEMPEMDGIATLKKIKERNLQVDVIMISAHTQAGAAVTMQALEEGAFDFIAKPNSSNLSESKEYLTSQIKAVLNSLHVRKRLNSVSLRKTLSSPTAATSVAAQPGAMLRTPAPATPATPASSIQTAASIPRKISTIPARCEIVAIGISTGGPNALARVIPMLPKELRVPVVIVQHMPPVFTAALAESLKRKSNVDVVEGVDNMTLRPGTVYIAPGGKQMKVEKNTLSSVIRITDAVPENNCKPSADYLFRSVAETYGKAALGVIMTGMGADGVKGLAVMKQKGATVFSQDETTCVVYGMPMEAVKAGVVDTVLPLDRIAPEIMSYVRMS